MINNCLNFLVFLFLFEKKLSDSLMTKFYCILCSKKVTKKTTRTVTNLGTLGATVFVLNTRGSELDNKRLVWFPAKDGAAGSGLIPVISSEVTLSLTSGFFTKPCFSRKSEKKFKLQLAAEKIDCSCTSHPPKKPGPSRVRNSVFGVRSLQ